MKCYSSCNKNDQPFHRTVSGTGLCPCVSAAMSASITEVDILDVSHTIVLPDVYRSNNYILFRGFQCLSNLSFVMDVKCMVLVQPHL